MQEQSSSSSSTVASTTSVPAPFRTTSRLACDCCRFRKTKCDRSQQLSQGRLACSFCSSSGLDCLVTPVHPKRKSGNRLNALLAGKSSSTISRKRAASPLPSESSGEENTGDAPSTSIRAIAHTIGDPTSRPVEEVFSFESPPQIHFLGIPGLTRAILDNCIDAFFAKLEHSMPLSGTTSDFKMRYHAFLDANAGLIVAPNVQPASELLVLAVACRGCDNTSNLNRYELSDAMVDRFCYLAETGDTIYLAGLDAIEAINLLSERASRSRHPIAKNGRHPSMLRYDVLGRGFNVELALSMRIHLPPPGPTSTKEIGRRRFLFWTIFFHDAFRSASACLLYRIQDEDIGWDIKNTVGPVRSNEHMEYAYYIYFLALIARRICRATMSARAKLQGVIPSDIVEILEALQAWYESLSTPFQFKWDESSPSSTFNQSENLDRALLSRRAFLLSIYLSLYLNMWASICETGYSPSDGSQKVSAASAEKKLDEAMLQSCFGMATLARHCYQQNLVDDAPNNLLNVPAAWTLWIARRISTAARLGRAMPEVHKLHLASLELIACVANAKSRKDSGQLAKSLREMIDRTFRLEKVEMQTSHRDPSMTGVKPTSSAVSLPNSFTSNPSRQQESVEVPFPSPTSANLSPEDSWNNLANSLISPSFEDGTLPVFPSTSVPNVSFTIPSPEWEALLAVSTEVQDFLSGFGFEMPSTDVK